MHTQLHLDITFPTMGIHVSTKKKSDGAVVKKRLGVK